MRIPRHLRVAILSLLLLLALPAPALAAASATFEEKLAIPAGTMLEVDTGSGSIEISVGPGRDVTVVGKVTVNRKRFWRRSADSEEILEKVLANPPVELEGDRLVVGQLRDRSLRDRVRFSFQIVVPADTRIDADTGSGSISVTGVAAPVAVSSGSGRLDLENIGGPVRAKAGSGSIRADQVAGEFRGSTGSGSIHLLQTAPGDVKVSTGSGSIQLSGVDGSLQASAGSGGIKVDGQQHGDWKLGTGSGSITVRLPADAAFNLDAESHSGGINIDHPVTVRGKISKRHLRGEVRGGGPLLKIDTGSGGIRIE
jgi:hypothetical protein